MHDLNEAFNEFFSSNEKDVLLLKGKWGSGKTHFWENNFSKYIYLDDTLKYYSCTSVYGKSSLDELQKDILFSIRSINHKNQTLKNERLNALNLTSAVRAI
ncbi:MAG: P-loop NTPase fold protein, partial [Candidatus Paceibacterota bacterium]